MSRRYEYRKESMLSGDKDMINQLNRMGEHGWHVSTSYTQTSFIEPSQKYIHFILARRIIDE